MGTADLLRDLSSERSKSSPEFFIWLSLRVQSLKKCKDEKCKGHFHFRTLLLLVTKVPHIKSALKVLIYGNDLLKARTIK